MFLRNCWYVAGWSRQITGGQIVARTIAGEPVILYRTPHCTITVWRIAAATGSRRCRAAGTIYCYSGGQFTRHTEEQRLRHQIELFGVAFREDKAMIEAQQEVINRSPGKLMMTLSFDRSVAQFRRLMGALEEEARSGQAA